MTSCDIKHGVGKVQGVAQDMGGGACLQESDFRSVTSIYTQKYTFPNVSYQYHAGMEMFWKSALDRLKRAKKNTSSADKGPERS